MAKNYILPEEIKSFLFFEVDGAEVFISPILQQDIRSTYEVYQSVAQTVDMINLLQNRTGAHQVTRAMVEAVLARPPYQPKAPEPETAADSDSNSDATDATMSEPFAVQTVPIVVAPDEPEVPPPPVVEDEETFDLWGQPLHISLELQQDIRCAYRILGSAEAAAHSLNRVKHLTGSAAVTSDMVQAVITRLLRQEDQADQEGQDGQKVD